MKGKRVEEQLVRGFIQNLYIYSGENEEFAENFWKKLKSDEEIFQEFIYYMEHGNFCKRLS